jgi:hypothetical protein
MSTLAAILALAVIAAQANPTPASVLARYVQALGGEAALRAIKTRVTEGEFDNGRGLRARYRIVEESPDKRVTIIGTDPIDAATGSGRGYDGVKGWDKSFIGTGLRALEGRELADAARDADMLRPLHLLDDCDSTTVEKAPAHIVIVCKGKAGGMVRHAFDTKTGLLATQDIEAGPRKVHISYEDYRAIDAITLPFKTHIDVAGATIKYDASSIKHNQAVDRAAFQQPKQ